MIIPAAKRLSQVQEYYFSKKLHEVRLLEASGRRILNLGIGNPELPPSPQTIDTLCQAAVKRHNHGYQPYRGTEELRSAMAEWYERTYGVGVNAEREILPLIGSKEGIFHISMAFLNPGDRVLVPDPGYPGYAAATEIVGAEAIRYDLDARHHWFPDMARLRQMDTTRTKLMWINYPHMPTGAVAGISHFAELLAFARERKILICHDNPYSLILNRSEPLSIFNAEGAMECSLELNSLSKSHHMAGWRVGMVVGKAAYLNLILKVKSNVDSGMFRPVQLAAVQALQNSRKWHKQQNKQYAGRRELIYQLLDMLGFDYSRKSAGMFVWAKAPGHIEDVETFLDELLYSRGIFMAPGKVFGRNGERYLRASVCAARVTIQQAIKILNEAPLDTRANHLIRSAPGRLKANA